MVHVTDKYVCQFWAKIVENEGTNRVLLVSPLEVKPNGGNAQFIYIIYITFVSTHICIINHQNGERDRREKEANEKKIVFFHIFETNCKLYRDVFFDLSNSWADVR